MGPVVAFVPDVMDRSRVSAAAAAAGRALLVARTLEELVSFAGERAVTLCLVDLGRPGVLEVLPRLGGVSTVGFASHVERVLIRDARAAGCDRVLARSVFFRSIGELMQPDAGATGP